jgi:hypothetical protein
VAEVYRGVVARARIRTLALIAVVIAVAGGCTSPARSAPSRPLSARDVRWQRDIAYLASRLPLVRVDGLGKVPMHVWDSAASTLEAQVPRLTDGQILVGMARMVAMIHDDETRVDLPSEPLYPLYAQWLGGGLYLLGVPPADRALLGGELLAVDGHPLSTVVARIGSTIDYEDPVFLRDREAGAMADAGLLNWLGITSSPTRAAFTVRTITGRTEIAEIRSTLTGMANWPAIWLQYPQYIDLVPSPLYRQDAASPYWLKVLPARHAVYLKYNQCLSDDGFQRLVSQAITLLMAHRDYRLIVDLRDNGGGNTAPFMSSLISAIENHQVNPTRVIGLVNQYTASSATDDANFLKQAGAALIGQTTAMSLDTFGDDATFGLPGSDIGIGYTTAIINGSMIPEGVPTVAVQPTLAQLMAGVDPVLAAALSYSP